MYTRNNYKSITEKSQALYKLKYCNNIEHCTLDKGNCLQMKSSYMINILEWLLISARGVMNVLA